MSHLTEPDATRDVDDLYAADRERLGYVANYTRAFAHRPAVYRAWQGLSKAIRATMDPVRYEVATLAAAGELRSSYCSLAHGEILAGQVGDDVAHQVATGGQTEETYTAIAELARKVAASAADITPADLVPLRGLGFGDADLLDVILAAAARCFFSSVLDATGAEPDAAYARIPEPLRSVLTVGRPIEGVAGPAD